MLDRRQVLREIVDVTSAQTALVSSLGYISRELFDLTHGERQRCFYCMGSMGSVIPLALGMAISVSSRDVLAIEGDGSLLMNLGCLATVRRYALDNFRAVIVDNSCYESTGGQQSQPTGFRIERLCEGAGLATDVARRPGEVEEWLRESARHPRILIAKTGCSAASGRISDPPALIGERFAAWFSGAPHAGATSPAWTHKGSQESR